MKAILPFAMLLGALAACGSNETETRVASACETAFVDQPGERSTFDSITTICGCFGKDTHHNEGSNYLGRMERAMADITQRRQERGMRGSASSGVIARGGSCRRTRSMLA